MDDEPVLRQLLVDLLRDEGFAVQTAGNGADALALHTEVPASLILTDLMMPQLIHAGRTSMVVRVVLNCRDPLSTDEQQATVGYFTMVAVDADGRPIEIPKFILEDQAEWKHAKHIRAAAQVRRARRQDSNSYGTARSSS